MYPASIEVVDTPKKAQELLHRLLGLPGIPIGFDTETVGIDPSEQAAASGHGQIVCWSLSIPTDELHPKRGVKLGSRIFLWADSLPIFQEWFENAAYLKVGHNIDFDRCMLRNHGIALRGVAGDTLHLSRLLYCDKRRSHGLKSLGKYWLEYDQPSFRETFSCAVPKDVKERAKCTHSTRKGIPTLLGTSYQMFATNGIIPLDKVRSNYPGRLPALYAYASLDAKITLELFFCFQAKLTSIPWKTWL